MLWHRQAIFKSKGDKLCSSAECRIWTRGPRHQIASRLNARWQTDWAIEDQAKKNWTRQPVPMISEHSAHLIPLSVDFRTWLWQYTCLLLLISMLWHRQAIFKSKGDKLCSSAECRIWTRGPRHQIASRLNARWQTDWAIEDQANRYWYMHTCHSSNHPFGFHGSVRTVLHAFYVENVLFCAYDAIINYKNVSCDAISNSETINYDTMLNTTTMNYNAILRQRPQLGPDAIPISKYVPSSVSVGLLRRFGSWPTYDDIAYYCGHMTYIIHMSINLAQMPYTTPANQYLKGVTWDPKVLARRRYRKTLWKCHTVGISRHYCVY